MKKTKPFALINGYERFFGLREAPFHLSPDTRYMVSLIDHNNAYHMLMYAIAAGEGFMKITGEVGMGKTMLCRRLMCDLEKIAQPIYIANPRLHPAAMRKLIALELGVQQRYEDGPGTLVNIQKRLHVLEKQGQSVILLIDEAQTIPEETLEEIRMISNLERKDKKLIQIIFFGQTEFDAMLDKKVHRPLKQRIGFSYQLQALDYNGLHTYILSRLRYAGYQGGMPFSYLALKALKKASKGSPRLVNILCHKCLLLAFAHNQLRIGRNDMIQAIADTDSTAKPMVSIHWYWLLPAILAPMILMATRIWG